MIYVFKIITYLKSVKKIILYVFISNKTITNLNSKSLINICKICNNNYNNLIYPLY